MLLRHGRTAHAPEQKTGLRQRGKDPANAPVSPETTHTFQNVEFELCVVTSACLWLRLQVSHKQMSQLILFSLLHQKQPARAIYEFKAQSAK